MTRDSLETTNSVEKFYQNLEILTFEGICETFEEKFGHGWKRRLAEMVEVPESTVHSWLKAGKAPSWLSKVLHLMVERSFKDESEYYRDQAIEDFKRAYQVVGSGNEYAVYRFEDGIGHLVANNIPDLDTAMEIASLPRAKATIKALIDELDDFALYLPEVAQEHALSELKDDAERWCRNASLDESGWEPNFSEIVIDAVRDTVKAFGTDASAQSSKAKRRR